MPRNKYRLLRLRVQQGSIQYTLQTPQGERIRCKSSCMDEAAVRAGIARTLERLNDTEWGNWMEQSERNFITSTKGRL